MGFVGTWVWRGNSARCGQVGRWVCRDREVGGLVRKGRGRVTPVYGSEQGVSANKFAGPVAPVPSDVWELDFYSRPVVGADGKRLWELIVTDSSGVLEVVEPVPNSMVNSRELRERFSQILEESPVKPRVVRYFRSQMTNMIRIALEDFGVVLRPSRRTYSLLTVLKDREKNVYPKMPGYKAGFKADAAFSTVKVPEKMPDALMGDKFAFAFSNLADLIAPDDGVGWKELCPVELDLPESTSVPGLVIFSSRAKAISAWMTGIELAGVSASLPRREVVLECGLNTQYLFARLSDSMRDEAKEFLDAKDGLDGLHFLAVQSTGKSEDVAGLWLLRDVDL
mmetsp:Transcript_11864/g.24177  ORF Transcript_11864/g.24177 Transcript_11864/m.24177 type:complete len:338 (-) Transcript_11864:579-1592(-)